MASLPFSVWTAENRCRACLTWGQPPSAVQHTSARIHKYRRIYEDFISHAYSRNLEALFFGTVRHPPNREGEKDDQGRTPGSSDFFSRLPTQQFTAFGRFGWHNGKTESFANTDVDQTFGGEVGAYGQIWYRLRDRAAVAFVSNAICKYHQEYLADGGLGFLLGDGKLNYGREKIVESYYTAHIWRGIYAAPGLQHIENPGYNRDRGPVPVPSFRGHVEF